MRAAAAKVKAPKRMVGKMGVGTEEKSYVWCYERVLERWGIEMDDGR